MVGKAKRTGVESVEQITQSILVFRGHKVLLDSELAELYGVPTKRLNEQVKRNAGRFPKDFLFRLTRAEVEALNRSHFAIYGANLIWSRTAGGRPSVPTHRCRVRRSVSLEMGWWKPGRRPGTCRLRLSIRHLALRRQLIRCSLTPARPMTDTGKFGESKPPGDPTLENLRPYDVLSDIANLGRPRSISK
jgi:hypothetical protein